MERNFGLEHLMIACSCNQVGRNDEVAHVPNPNLVVIICPGFGITEGLEQMPWDKIRHLDLVRNVIVWRKRTRTEEVVLTTRTEGFRQQAWLHSKIPICRRLGMILASLGK
jgi:hypothetical protein